MNLATLSFPAKSIIMLSNNKILLSKLEAGMTNTTTVKVSKRYQIAVPALARQLLNIQSGDRLLVDIQDGMMVLIPRPENYTEALCWPAPGNLEGCGCSKVHR